MNELDPYAPVVLRTGRFCSSIVPHLYVSAVVLLVLTALYAHFTSAYNLRESGRNLVIELPSAVVPAIDSDPDETSDGPAMRVRSHASISVVVSVAIFVLLVANGAVWFFRSRQRITRQESSISGRFRFASPVRTRPRHQDVGDWGA